jgi:hypothetical protein
MLCSACVVHRSLLPPVHVTEAATQVPLDAFQIAYSKQISKKRKARKSMVSTAIATSFLAVVRRLSGLGRRTKRFYPLPVFC